jgi:hypothetical protein
MGLFTVFMVLFAIPYAVLKMLSFMLLNNYSMKIIKNTLPELFHSQHLVQLQQLQSSLCKQSPG